MKSKQPSVLLLLSDDVQDSRVCRSLRESPRAPEIFHADMLSEALRVLNNNDIDVFICDQTQLSFQTKQTFRILLSKYPTTHLLFYSEDPVDVGQTGLEDNERVGFVEGVENILPTLLSWDICRERRARPRTSPADILARPADRSSEEIVELKRLTPRQNEILQALSSGLSNKEIARKLGIQETTVKVQLKPIYRVLQVSNRTQAAVLMANRNRAANPSRPQPINLQPDALRNFNVFFPTGAWPAFQYGNGSAK